MELLDGRAGVLAQQFLVGRVQLRRHKKGRHGNMAEWRKLPPVRTESLLIRVVECPDLQGDSLRLSAAVFSRYAISMSQRGYRNQQAHELVVFYSLIIHS